MIAPLIHKFQKAAAYDMRVSQVSSAISRTPILQDVPNPIAMWQSEQYGKLQRVQQAKVGSFASAGILGVAGAGLGMVAGGLERTFDPLGVPSTATNALSIGAHILAGSELMRTNKLLGLGYLGLVGMNAARKGDQWGPM